MALLAAIGILAGAAVAHEILLVRLFSILLWHHFAYMIISVALLGIGASGAALAAMQGTRLVVEPLDVSAHGEGQT